MGLHTIFLFIRRIVLSNESLPQGFISYVGLKDADPDCLLIGSSAPS